MKHINYSRYSITALLAASLLASGCSTNPYVRTPGIQTSLPIASTTTSQFAGDLEQAIKDVDVQRFAYFDRLEERTNQRNILSGLLIGFSAAALYNGVTASAGASNRAVLNTGAVAGAAYAMGSYSNSPNTELAYITATDDLTCLVLRTRPWLVTKSEFSTFTASVTALTTATNALDALFQKQAAQSGDSRNFVSSHNFEKLILYKARVTLRKASNFQGFVETAGFQLRQEAMLVSNRANFEIHRLQPELANPSTMLAGLRNTSQAFRDIKPLDVPPPETQKEEGNKNDDDTPKTEQPSPPTGSGDTKTPITASKTTPDTSPTAVSASGIAADKLEKQVAEQAKLLAAQEKVNDKRAKRTAAKLKDLTADLKSLTFVVTALKTSPTSTVNLVVSKLDTAAAEKLAIDLSNVLAAMRPVNAVLTRAYSLKPYVKSIAQCQPLNEQTFQFALDADEVTLNPGQSFDVAVKGGMGIPRIWLSGAKGDAKGEMPKFTTTIDGGLARAQLTILATTPPGEMYIMAVDGSGKQRDDIKVIVATAPKK